MRTGPLGPTVNVAVLVPTGAPVPVVNTSGFYKTLRHSIINYTTMVNIIY